jgi:hypothetical protein
MNVERRTPNHEVGAHSIFDIGNSTFGIQKNNEYRTPNAESRTGTDPFHANAKGNAQNIKWKSGFLPQ